MWLYFMRVSPDDPKNALDGRRPGHPDTQTAKMTSPHFIAGCKAAPNPMPGLADPHLQRR